MLPHPDRDGCAPAGTSPTRRRRCWPCSATATSRRRRRSSAATTTRSAAPRSCGRSSAPRRRPRRRRGARRTGRHARLRHRHRRQPVVRRARSRSDGARRGRRGDAQRRRRRRRPRPGGAARQLLVGRPSPALHARRARRCRHGCCDGGRRAPRAVRLRQGLAQQRVPRRRRRAPCRAAHARDHRHRPRARCRSRASRPTSPSRATSLVLVGRTRPEFAGSHFDTRARRRGRASAPCPQPDRRRPGPVPAAPRRDARPGWSARATTSARVVSPSPSPRWASPAGSASTIDRAPARRRRHRALRRVDRAVRRRGRAGRRRPVRRRRWATTVASCSATSPTTPTLRLPARRAPVDVDDLAAARSPARRRHEPPARAGRRRDRAPTATATPPFALDLAGAEPKIVLVGELVERPQRARPTPDLVVVAGGFSYADALGAGRMLALELRRVGRSATRCARSSPPAGRCSGSATASRCSPACRARCPARSATTSGRFDCRWVRLAPRSEPVHLDAASTTGSNARSPTAKGRYVHDDPAALAAAGQVALRYAGATPTARVPTSPASAIRAGVVLGLMPHPENHVVARQHPASPARWRRARASACGCSSRRPLRQGAVR